MLSAILILALAQPIGVYGAYEIEFLGMYIPEISRKMGFKQVNQGLSSFFAEFDDFSMFRISFSMLHFEKSSNMQKIGKNWRKALFNLS